ncbi:MAG: tetratricopeptide repeat protein [Xanthomonadales bacterium]|nr:tetratricopeptide repeat protein [Xanthomonadales bacterium]
MFWFLAFAITATTMLAVCWPMIREAGIGRSAALSVVAVSILLVLLLYRGLGTPAGLDVSGRPEPPVADAGQEQQLESLLAQLESRLQKDPRDVDGWIMLGRSYKTMQQYDKAVTALEAARAQSPDNPLVLVELAEARMFASGQPVIGANERALLQRAVANDPGVQKGLWLLGVAASQDGNEELAIQYWQDLMSRMDPQSQAASAVQQQIDAARDRAGIPNDSTWPGWRIKVGHPKEPLTAPPGSALFVIAREPGGQGPPLGVYRVDEPSFPVELTLDDRSSMLPQRPVSAAESVEVSARLSLSGRAAVEHGDLTSDTLSLSPGHTEPVHLRLKLR